MSQSEVDSTNAIGVLLTVMHCSPGLVLQPIARIMCGVLPFMQ